MLLKFLVAGLAIAFCTLLGYFAAGKYRARKSFFSQLCDLNERYLSELEYRRKPLGEFLKDCKFTGDFAKTAELFLAQGRAEIKYSYLTKSEREEAENYFGQLGRGNTEAQAGFFGAKRAQLCEWKEKSAAEAKKRGELYLKLGLLAGLAFVILIV